VNKAGSRDPRETPKFRNATSFILTGVERELQCSEGWSPKFTLGFGMNHKYPRLSRDRTARTPHDLTIDFGDKTTRNSHNSPDVGWPLLTNLRSGRFSLLSPSPGSGRTTTCLRGIRPLDSIRSGARIGRWIHPKFHVTLLESADPSLRRSSLSQSGLPCPSRVFL